MASSDNTELYIGGAAAVAVAAWYFRGSIASALGIALPAALAPPPVTDAPPSAPGTQTPDPLAAAQAAAAAAAAAGATANQQAIAAQTASTVTAPPLTPVQIAAAAAAQLAAQLQTQQYQAALLAAKITPAPTPAKPAAAPPPPGTVLAPGVVVSSTGSLDTAGAVQDAQLYTYLASLTPTYATDAYGNVHQVS